MAFKRCVNVLYRVFVQSVRFQRAVAMTFARTKVKDLLGYYKTGFKVIQTDIICFNKYLVNLVLLQCFGLNRQSLNCLSPLLVQGVIFYDTMMKCEIRHFIDINNLYSFLIKRIHSRKFCSLKIIGFQCLNGSMWFKTNTKLTDDARQSAKQLDTRKKPASQAISSYGL